MRYKNPRRKVTASKAAFDAMDLFARGEPWSEWVLRAVAAQIVADLAGTEPHTCDDVEGALRGYDPELLANLHPLTKRIGPRKG